MSINKLTRLLTLLALLPMAPAMAVEANKPMVGARIAQARILSKAEILRAAVGQYPLESIFGSGGVTGMWDTYKSEGRWGSFFSSVTGTAMRETENIVLSASDLALLNGLVMSVEPDLSVRLSSNRAVLLSIAYVPDGMEFKLTSFRSELVTEQPLYSEKNTVQDGHLYLLMQDGVDYSKTLDGSFYGSIGNTILLSYSIKDKAINMRLMSDNCCGGSTWTFKRQRDQ